MRKPYSRLHPPRRRRKRGTAGRPDYKGKAVMVVGVNPETGRTETRTMRAADAARLMGNSKGGRTKAARGNTNGNFTSETAKKASLKGLRKRWGKFNRRIGRRLGCTSVASYYLDREILRERYRTPEAVEAARTQAGAVAYVGGSWVRDGNRISERTALTALGYIKPRRKRMVPVKVVGVITAGAGSTQWHPVEEKDHDGK